MSENCSTPIGDNTSTLFDSDVVCTNNGDDDTICTDKDDPDVLLGVLAQAQPSPNKSNTLKSTDLISENEDDITCPTNDITTAEAFRIFKETYLDNFGYSISYFAKVAEMEKNRLKLLINGRRAPTDADMTAISRGIERLDATRAAGMNFATNQRSQIVST